MSAKDFDRKTTVEELGVFLNEQESSLKIRRTSGGQWRMRLVPNSPSEKESSCQKQAPTSQKPSSDTVTYQ